MRYSPPPLEVYNPRMVLAHAYNIDTRKIPSVPIAIHLGIVAMCEVGEGRMTLPDVVTFPDQLEEPHLAIMREAAIKDHGPRRRPPPSDKMLAKTAGFDIAWLLTAARELFRGDRGEALETIIKPQGLDDPTIIEAIKFLTDPDNRQTLRTALEVVDKVVCLPTTRRNITRPYKDAITEFANDYDGVTPESDPVQWGQLMSLMGWQRKIVATRLRGRFTFALLAEQDPENEHGKLRHLTEHQAVTLAHNLTRYHVAPEWFK